MIISLPLSSLSLDLRVPISFISKICLWFLKVNRPSWHVIKATLCNIYYKVTELKSFCCYTDSHNCVNGDSAPRMSVPALCNFVLWVRSPTRGTERFTDRLWAQCVSNGSTGVLDDKKEGFFRAGGKLTGSWAVDILKLAAGQLIDVTLQLLGTWQRLWEARRSWWRKLRWGESDWAIRYRIRANLGLLVFGKSFMKWKTERQKPGLLLLN